MTKLKAKEFDRLSDAQKLAYCRWYINTYRCLTSHTAKWLLPVAMIEEHV